MTVVEAGAGFGKTALAAECADVLPVVAVTARLDARDADVELFVSRLRRAFRLAGLSDLAAATQSTDAIDNVLTTLAATNEPVLLVLDDVHNAESDELTSVIVDLASSLPNPHRMLILGRNLAGASKKFRYAHGVAALTATELAFEPTEVANLLGSFADHHAQDVIRVTQGWPAAVVLSARRLERGAGLADRISDPHNAVAELVQLVLEDLGPADQGAAVQLGYLPLVSQPVVAAVTGDAATWDRLTRAGLPIADLPGPVRDYLVSRESLRMDVARRAADAYVDAGEIRAALDLLVAAHDYTSAADVISSHARRAVPPLEFSEIVGVVDAMPDEAVAEYPRALIVLARLAGRADRHVNRFAALTRLEALLASGPANRRLEDELHIEVAHDLLRLWRSEEAAQRIEGMAERLTSDEAHTRAQLLAIQGRFSCRAGDFETGIQLLRDAIQLALQLGDRDHASACTYSLATEGFYEIGRIEDALETTKQSLALAVSPTHRLGRLNLVADFATDLGRYEEAEAALTEQAELARLMRSERWAAYVPWTRARIASQQGDATRTKRAVEDVARRTDEAWFNESMRVVFWTDAADILGRVGEAELARRYITDALELWDGNPTDVIDTLLEARVGDPVVAAQKFAALDDNRERRESWRKLLLEAFAAHRRGDPSAASLAADAFDRAAADGLMSSLMARESAIAEQLVGLAAEAGSLAAQPLAAGALPWSITLLGGFAVRQGGRTIALPPGKPCQAVKLLAANGGRATIDEFVDALWPDQDLETGRRGVRNLLNRLKPAAADLVLRDGTDLVLNPSTTVDADQFELDAKAALALAADDPTRAGLARSAIGRYHGELLPSDRYEQWATLPRERAQRRFSDVLDLVIDDAEASGEIDEAVRLCERAIEADPYDDGRYLRAARLLHGRGRRTHARAIVDRATAMLAELGLEPTGELAALRSELHP